MEKRLVCLTAVLICLAFIPISVQAEQAPMIDGQGRVQLIERAPTLRELSPVELEVYSHPGQEIACGPVTFLKYERVDFFHLRQIVQYGQAAIYDGNTIKVLNKTIQDSGQAELCLYVVLGLMAIGIMLLSNFLVYALRFDADKDGFSVVVAEAFLTFAITAMVAFTTAFTATICIFLCAVTAICAAVFALTAVTDGHKNAYYLCSMIFYVCMLVVVLI